MIIKLLKSYTFFLLLIMIFGCKEKEDEIVPDTLTIENYIGKYSGTITRIKMSENGWVMNYYEEKVQTDVIITPIEGFSDQLMVYVTAYHDSIRTQFDPEFGYLIIQDKPYSFYSRTSDFPKFNGNYANAVSTYGNMNQSRDRFGINYLKDLNDSIYLCDTSTKKNSKL